MENGELEMLKKIGTTTKKLIDYRRSQKEGGDFLFRNKEERGEGYNSTDNLRRSAPHNETNLLKLQARYLFENQTSILVNSFRKKKSVVLNIG